MDLEAREKKQQKRLRKEKRKEPDSSLSNALDNPHSRANSSKPPLPFVLDTGLPREV
jgi:hypothetical protein